jgi:hypothetical protein
MRLTSTTDKEFLKTLKDWLDSQSEIMVLIRYTRAAGNKSFEFFTSFAALSERLHQLRPQTCITAFRRAQLPLRGVVDDIFIDACLRNIPDGSEFVVVETVRRTAGQYSWFHDEAGETHEELRESLEASRGSPVAVGEYPPWLEDSPDMISGYVPDEDALLGPGSTKLRTVSVASCRNQAIALKIPTAFDSLHIEAFGWNRKMSVMGILQQLGKVGAVYCLNTNEGPLTRFPFRSTVTSTRSAILTNGIPLFIP